jgi:hypothetical protein
METGYYLGEGRIVGPTVAGTVGLFFCAPISFFYPDKNRLNSQKCAIKKLRKC